MQSTLAIISLRRIVNNALLVKERAGAPLYAVVKDDAYGHGAERVSLALEPYVEGFAVATVLEGAALRCAGVGKDILVLTPCLTETEAISCLGYRLIPTISSFASLSILERAAKIFSIPIKAQIAVNTGMNRYGFAPEQIEIACKRLISSGGIAEGVFSHFYAPEDEFARETQYKLFQEGYENVKRFFPQIRGHLSATGGILAGKKYNFDFVRCGIALYGYLPKGFENAIPVQPAMKIYAAAAQNLEFLGGGICYRKAERQYQALSAFRLGYGDGFPRSCRIGNIHELCMDAFVKEGNYPFGKYQLMVSDIQEFADRQGMIVYEALLGISRKAEKKYV